MRLAKTGCLTNQNTVLGDDALLNNTGSYNTAIGVDALFSNTIGSSNTAIGVGALYSNTIAGSNTAIGFEALNSNTTSVASCVSIAAPDSDRRIALFLGGSCVRIAAVGSTALQ